MDEETKDKKFTGTIGGVTASTDKGTSEIITNAASEKKKKPQE